MDNSALEPSCSATGDDPAEDNGVIHFDNYVAMQTGKTTMTLIRKISRFAS